MSDNDFSDYYDHNKTEYVNYINRYPPSWAQNVSTKNTLNKKLTGLRFTTVFEVGMGYGLFGKLILDGFEIERFVGIDLSSDQIEAAQKYLEEWMLSGRVDVSVANIATYKSRTKFDLVFCSTVLSHIPPNLIESAIKNMCRVAKKYIVIVEPTTEVMKRLNKNLEKKYDQWLYDYATMFRQHGWAIVDHEDVCGFPIEYMRFEKVK